MSRLAADCLLCAEETPVVVPYPRLGHIVRCTRCQLVFAVRGAAPVPVYDELYYRGGVYADYLLGRQAIHHNAEPVLASIERLTSGRELLDVGCAAGFFVEAAIGRGWSAKGLESSPYASGMGRDHYGLPVIAGSILTPPDDLARVDVVTLWDTIEHLDRPDVALKNIHELLKPGGLLVLSTGDYDALARRVLGDRWRLFADHTHNFFFSPATLRGFLSRAGLKVVELDHRGKRVNLSMILQQSPLPFGRRAAQWIAGHGWTLDLPVNAWDVMTVFARRC